MAEEKLFKAEYAKSGRASCKKCGESIAKESLRLAIMVQSPMFDGKVPHWHHYACFWKRARVVSPSDVDGLSDLRWDDQEKIKKAIETGGTGGGKGGEQGDSKGEKTLIDFAVEYAKSNRSTCKGCSEKIEKDTVRVSKKMIDPEKPQLGMIDRWYHPACFVTNRAELGYLPTYSATQLKGFSTLSAEDKAALKKQLPAVKSEGKRKGDAVDGEATARKKNKKEDKISKLEKELKEQSQLIWNIKDELKKCCSTNDLRELLIANKQEVASGEAAILDQVSDGMAFGALLPCEECKGQLLLKGDAYCCTGNITAWTKCSASTQTPARKDWLTPKEFHEIPYLKKFKFKKHVRIFPPAVPASSAEIPASTDPAIPLEPAGFPLADMKVLILGKLSKKKDELKTLVEEFGGKITNTASKAKLCISSQKELDKMSKKMEEVKEANVRVVSEDLLDDLRSGKGLQELLSVHGISSWGAELTPEVVPEPPVAGKSTGSKVTKNSSGKAKQEQESGKSEKKMKLTVKGGAAVDPDSGLEDSAHVFEQGGRILSATLGLVDISRSQNSYYKLQLLEDDNKKRYWVFRSWGRVGTTIGGNKLEKMSSKEEAVDHFLGLYEEKTGNAWHSKNFTKYPKKFYPLEIDYGQDEEAVKKLTANCNTKSKLDKAVQDLIKTIFDVESMKKAMVEFEIDLQKMPLGKLSKRQIQSAYAILSEVQQVVANNGAESQILDLSNRFYTLIPHDFGMKKPPLLNNEDYIQAKVQMLDSLLDIEVAYSLLQGGKEDDAKNPIDVNYEKLHTQIKVLAKETDEAKLIVEYVKNTHAVTHNQYDLEVMEIFKIKREGEEERFEPFSELHNRQLLWHGSRITNFAGILSQGLRIAPPEAPVTGYMFGKGVYFADMVSKSANYCHASQAEPVGLILLAEVALGNMHELKRANHITKLPKGKHSVKGIGKTAPDPNATVKMNGVDIPLGKGVQTQVTDSSLLYNEYIVYDVAQVNLKYLLKLNFKFKTSLW
ncbi:poly [ADP-ribose] polymerase 1 [Hemiscyllium ocellatum]|uniref:poly [ADP-ribose] polymerase 1 n=1 Tax=Hemiscyllium ocellatum TaxID=170820 RepID=UPI00296700CE|nr:poly [ADP-ribose] polymerase 1 [Hemiscyllium ocellatum]